MTSSLHNWESDPLFSAAEVVQDSADRMESLYRLLLHEQSLVHGDHPDSRLLMSIDYHGRDLVTILETTKWQLEDFERAVGFSAMMNKSQTTEDVILRHNQFIEAIREQIIQVEKSLEDLFSGKSIRNSEWIALNNQDTDGFALFLSGRNPPENVIHHHVEDSSILRRFLNPKASSSSQDDGTIEHDNKEMESLKMNGFLHVHHCCSSEKENNLRKVGSHYSTRMGLDSLDSLQGTSCGRHNEDQSWDLEANETIPKSVFHENKLRRCGGSMNILRYLNNLWSAQGSTSNRSYTKRLKDGEEERNSPSSIDICHAAQGQRMGISLASRERYLQGFCFGYLAKAIDICLRLRACRAICQRFSRLVQANQHSIQMILAALFTLAVFGILIYRIA